MEIEPRSLAEYTQVIIKEADRLQLLVDRLLAPHRKPHVVGNVNIHEVCERVRALVLAEFPRGLATVRDYDISIPEFSGDREQLIQAVLNIARNAAEALAEQIERGTAQIVLRTRVVAPGDARQTPLSSGTGIAYRGQRAGRPGVLAREDLLSSRVGPRRRLGARADARTEPSSSSTMARSSSKANQGGRSSRSSSR